MLLYRLRGVILDALPKWQFNQNKKPRAPIKEPAVEREEQYEPLPADYLLYTRFCPGRKPIKRTR
jgi:hypothetical protein